MITLAVISVSLVQLIAAFQPDACGNLYEMSDVLYRSFSSSARLPLGDRRDCRSDVPSWGFAPRSEEYFCSIPSHADRKKDAKTPMPPES